MIALRRTVKATSSACARTPPAPPAPPRGRALLLRHRRVCAARAWLDDFSWTIFHFLSSEKAFPGTSKPWLPRSLDAFYLSSDAIGFTQSGRKRTCQILTTGAARESGYCLCGCLRFLRLEGKPHTRFSILSLALNPVLSSTFNPAVNCTSLIICISMSHWRSGERHAPQPWPTRTGLIFWPIRLSIAKPCDPIYTWRPQKLFTSVGYNLVPNLIQNRLENLVFTVSSATGATYSCRFRFCFGSFFVFYPRCFIVFG